MKQGSLFGKRMFFSIILLSLVTFGIGIAVFRNEENAEAIQKAKESTRPVRVTYLKGSASIETRSFPGVVQATRETDLAFRVSASMASKESLAKGEPFLLEPIMEVEVFVPESFMGEVIGDLNSRGGKIESINPKSDIQVIQAVVPLSNMFGYSTSLRSASQGRGTFSMQFSHFDKN